VIDSKQNDIIKTKNFRQLILILTKIIITITNTFFSAGFKLPQTNEFSATFDRVSISHQEGYMYLHATPEFQKIDLYSLLFQQLQKAGYNLEDFINAAFNDESIGVTSDSISNIIISPLAHISNITSRPRVEASRPTEEQTEEPKEKPKRTKKPNNAKPEPIKDKVLHLPTDMIKNFLAGYYEHKHKLNPEFLSKFGY
jgi:hypothetical protein